MESIYSKTLKQLEEEMVALNQKKYRATQIYTWLYQKKADSFSKMSDISLKFIPILEEKYSMELPKIIVKQVASDGTIKLLLELSDGAKIETVLMRYDYGLALCVTSQVGCNMGCAFCASGLLKKQRNLTAGEIVSQILVMESLLDNERVSHVVVMGTGEPFDNYDNVMDFVKIINEPKGLAIGARHITISTCGIAPKIEEYAQSGLQINLAISLHAPNNELRNKLMPINKAYPLEVLFESLKKYLEITGRRITFEYILLKGINDSQEHANQLAKLIKGTFSYVNLIPYNSVDEKGFKRTSREEILSFQDKLKKLGVNVTVRKEFGTDIDAACGQLRAKKLGVIKND